MPKLKNSPACEVPCIQKCQPSEPVQAGFRGHTRRVTAKYRQIPEMTLVWNVLIAPPKLSQERLTYRSRMEAMASTTIPSRRYAPCIQRVLLHPQLTCIKIKHVHITPSIAPQAISNLKPSKDASTRSSARHSHRRLKLVETMGSSELEQDIRPGWMAENIGLVSTHYISDPSSAKQHLGPN